MVWSGKEASDTFRGREPEADGNKHLPVPPALLQDLLVWIYAGTTETGPNFYCWFSWVTPLHNTSSDEHAMSQVLHEGYTLLKNNTLANLVTAEHGSVWDISTQDQAGKSSSRKSPWNPFGLWSMLLHSIMDSTVTYVLQRVRAFLRQLSSPTRGKQPRGMMKFSCLLQQSMRILLTI